MSSEQPLPDDYRPAADTLQGRNVLITGAGNGLGRALALAAARVGATVILLDRQVRAIESVYDEIVAAAAPQPALYPMDLLGASPDDHAEMFARIDDAIGPLHGLVQNAAELGKPAPIEHYDVQTWLRTVQVDLNAPFLLCRYALPRLRRAPHGRMVFVSDRAGRRGRPYTGAYGVAKSGLEGLMRTVAAEQPDDAPLIVTSVDPGTLHTSLRRRAYPGEPTARLPAPEAVADKLVYLLDPLERPRHGGAYSASAEMS